METKLDVKKKPPKGWEQILDINRLATKGYVWWMLSVPKNAEKLAADYIDVVFPERFPGVKFEVSMSSLTLFFGYLTEIDIQGKGNDPSLAERMSVFFLRKL